MLKPAKRLLLRDPIHGEFELDPERDRVALDFWAARLHPEWFMPATPGDTFAAARHRETLERALRQEQAAGGQTRRRRATMRRPRAPFRLPDGPSGSWRLP